MIVNKLIQFFSKEKLNTPDEVYQFVSYTAATQQLTREPERLITALKEREASGSIQIAEQVVLPHVESADLQQSQIFILRLTEAIAWPSIGSVKLIIAILLKEDETVVLKKEIATFTRKLADDNFIEDLLTNSNTAILNERIAQ